MYHLRSLLLMVKNMLKANFFIIGRGQIIDLVYVHSFSAHFKVMALKQFRRSSIARRAPSRSPLQSNGRRKIEKNHSDGSGATPTLDVVVSCHPYLCHKCDFGLILSLARALRPTTMTVVKCRPASWHPPPLCCLQTGFVLTAPFRAVAGQLRLVTGDSRKQ